MLFLQHEDKFQSAVRYLLGMDCSTVEDYRVFDNGQSQTCAAYFSASSFVYTVKAFKQA